MNIGAHQSVAGGFTCLGRDALSIGANTFQIFLRNPRGTRVKAFDTKDATQLSQILKEHQFAPFVAHAPYTLNPCSPNAHLRELSGEILSEDVERLSFWPGNYYNIHPGSHGGQGLEIAIEQIAALLNKHLPHSGKARVLLETMSGKGSEVGQNFEELKAIIDRVEHNERLGICFDSCHLFCAGYDVVNDLDGVLEAFDTTIGMDRLYAFHLNDSAHPLGSHKDRHVALGQGCIGKQAIARIINHPLLRDTVFITETPFDLKGHGEEIAWLKEAYKS